MSSDRLKSEEIVDPYQNTSGGTAREPHDSDRRVAPEVSSLNRGPAATKAPNQKGGRSTTSRVNQALQAMKFFALGIVLLGVVFFYRRFGLVQVSREE